MLFDICHGFVNGTLRISHHLTHIFGKRGNMLNSEDHIFCIIISWGPQRVVGFVILRWYCLDRLTHENVK